MITQRLILTDPPGMTVGLTWADTKVWACAGCGAQLHESTLEHPDDCPEMRPAVADRGRLRRQAAEIDWMRKVLERKNRELDALHLVWCDGGCRSGVHRWSGEKVTRELVETAERNTGRLRRWYDSVKWRLEHYQAGTETEITPGYTFVASQWHEERALRIAAKTDLLEDKPEGQQ